MPTRLKKPPHEIIGAPSQLEHSRPVPMRASPNRCIELIRDIISMGRLRQCGKPQEWRQAEARRVRHDLNAGASAMQALQITNAMLRLVELEKNNSNAARGEGYLQEETATW